MAVSEPRTNKITKKTRERKPSRTLDKELISQAIETEQESPNDSEAKRNDKKPQGIVIDGKTYTCATCKAGHRVGVCKHGKERPMKATHPPGRPPAGAPKKVVCDCPKSCSCAKKDCKCARRCNCTQAMYMLVYIPAPDEDEDHEDEKGSWELGEQVMTDLKGNILTPEQVRERREKKDAQKIPPAFEPKPPAGTIAANETTNGTTSVSDTAPSGPRNCCKHKENVSNRSTAAQASPMSGLVAKTSAEGCNCGHACNCAFCPQHPNNSTSLNAARQQAMHFANHPSMDEQSIVPFLPTMPQEFSCMGGQPRFAMSRHAGPPSSKQLQTIFPNPGYVIGYPVWPLRNDQNNFAMQQFQTGNEHSFVDTIPMVPTRTNSLQYSAVPLASSHTAHNFGFPPEEYGIGDAFVASAGVEGWDGDAFGSGGWHFDDSASVTTPFSQVPGPLDGTTPFHEMPADLDSILSPTVSFHPVSDLDTHHFISEAPLPGPPNLFPSNSCCQTVADKSNPLLEGNMSKTDCFSPSMASDAQNGYGGLA